jgi:hypothetical protein
VARPAAALDQAMAVEDRMDGAFGRNPDIAVEPSDQQLPDLARAPAISFTWRVSAPRRGTIPC